MKEECSMCGSDEKIKIYDERDGRSRLTICYSCFYVEDKKGWYLKTRAEENIVADFEEGLLVKYEEK